MTRAGTERPSSYQSVSWYAHEGRALLLVQSTEEPGEIRVCASADGLNGAEVTMASWCPQ